MRPSKKKSKSRKGKPPPPQTEGSSSASPEPDLPTSSAAARTETLTPSSQSRSTDLAWLTDAFSSLSIKQIESAYAVAGCDAFKAAGILGTHLEEGTLEQDKPLTTTPELTEGPSRKKCKKTRPPKQTTVSCGMVSGVVGKRPHMEMHETDEVRQGEDEMRKKSSEEVEQFLCSMLGDESELGLGVVRDILGLCSGDIGKALELLLQLSDSSYRPQIREQHIPAVKNSVNYSHIFGGMGCKKTPESNTTFQYGDQASSLPNYSSARDSDFLSMRPERRSKAEMEQNVLESLFKLHETPERRNNNNPPDTLDWRKIVKELKNSQDYEFHTPGMPATMQAPAGKRDGYQEFQTAAQQNWNMMKTYYQRAALEYSRGNRSHATILAEKGNYYRELAREEDERASLEIFKARNQGIINTLTVDFHGQHVKQAIGLLKRHLLSLACIPSVHYLRVITGCGEDGVGKGKMKRSVRELAIRENLEWSEENSGTIKLTIKGRKVYTFTASDEE